MRGGLIPHARQGGRGVRALAVDGSKLRGTSFENEQIGQIHVAEVACVGAGDEVKDLSGLPDEDAVVTAGEALRNAPDDRLVTLG